MAKESFLNRQQQAFVTLLAYDNLIVTTKGVSMLHCCHCSWKQHETMEWRADVMGCFNRCASAPVRFCGSVFTDPSEKL